jgi:hypothetical protein
VATTRGIGDSGSAQTLSQALRARSKKRAPAPRAPRPRPPRRYRTRRWPRVLARFTRRIVALGVLAGAVAAVWFLVLKPVVQPERSAEKTRTAGLAKPATSLGTRLKSLSTGGFTPGLATSRGLPGLASLQVAVVDASGPHNGGLQARRYLHQLGMHPVPLDSTDVRLTRSVVLYKPGWHTRGLAFARLLGLKAQKRRTIPGVPAKAPLVLVIGSRGL